MGSAEESTLDRLGFAGPFESNLTSDHLQFLAGRSAEIVLNRIEHPGYGRPSVRDWHLVIPEFREALTCDAIRDAIRSAVSAPSIKLWRSKIFEKHPGDGPLEWHQEYGYFDGEELGGHRPALLPLTAEPVWNWTVWLALTDVGPDDGIMEFLPSSHRTVYAKTMVPMTSSDAYMDPSIRYRGREEIISRLLSSTLVLDVDTSALLNGIDPDALDAEAILAIVREHCSRLQAVSTLPFDTEGSSTLAVPRGHFILFNQRTMHRSRGSTTTSQLRLALSGRYTDGSTIVYPQKRYGHYVDGSGLDISRHRSISLYGEPNVDD